MMSVVERILIVPEVGMSVDSKKKAYEMYSDYASEIGFRI